MEPMISSLPQSETGDAGSTESSLTYRLDGCSLLGVCCCCSELVLSCGISVQSTPSRIAAALLAHLHAPPAMDQANGLMVLYFGLTVQPDTTPSSLVEPWHRQSVPLSRPGPSSFYGRQIEFLWVLEA
jgi:hypothetical protein